MLLLLQLLAGLNVRLVKAGDLYAGERGQSAQHGAADHKKNEGRRRLGWAVAS